MGIVTQKLGGEEPPRDKSRPWRRRMRLDRRIVAAGRNVFASSAVRVWAMAALIVGSTYALVFLVGLAPQEWVAEATFIAAHLVAAEVIISGHRKE